MSLLSFNFNFSIFVSSQHPPLHGLKVEASPRRSLDTRVILLTSRDILDLLLSLSENQGYSLQEKQQEALGQWTPETLPETSFFFSCLFFNDTLYKCSSMIRYRSAAGTSAGMRAGSAVLHVQVQIYKKVAQCCRYWSR